MKVYLKFEVKLFLLALCCLALAVKMFVVLINTPSVTFYLILNFVALLIALAVPIRYCLIKLKYNYLLITDNELYIPNFSIFGAIFYRVDFKSKDIDFTNNKIKLYRGRHSIEYLIGEESVTRLKEKIRSLCR